MAKPAGAACNYACAYCYYLEKRALVPRAPRLRLDGPMLERFVRDNIAAQEGPEVHFTWQGGEPTLLGRPYFERVLDLQARHCPPGKRVLNALQTHGGLLDRDWASFLARNRFLVGLSLDGPRGLHDRGRRDRKGRSTFAAGLRALELLRDHGVDFNTLTVVHSGTAHRGAEIYRFLRRRGVRHMQFVPVVERLDGRGALAGPPEPADHGDHAASRLLSPWTVPADGFGRFLCAVFEAWKKADVGKVFVQVFDVLLGLHMGHPSALCTFARTCGRTPVLEHNGDLYACDHYVYPDHRLGNIADTPLAALADGPRQRAFGEAKRSQLPPDCIECRFLDLCGGGCPKHRFAPARDGTPTLNYLCPSYRMLFAHAEADLRRMADLLRVGLPAALSMEKPPAPRGERAPRRVGPRDRWRR